jgi:Pyruvate/2-oxoacid:ferredoxin oxidoreductase gamma subunit
VAKDGIVVYDSSTISDPPDLRDDLHVYPVPLTAIAHDLGKVVAKNMVAVGAVQEAAKLLHEDSLLDAIERALADKCSMIPLNREAFQWGVKSVREGITQLAD